MLNNGDSHAQPAADDVLFAEETFEAFYADAQALMEQHYREIATHLDIALAMDVAAYRAVEAAGRLCVLTARLDQRLVGYGLFIVGPHPHYQRSRQAQQDVLYLDVALRHQGVGAAFLRFSEQVFVAKGVQLVMHHVKVAHPALGTLLARHGYDVVEHLYSKRLDRPRGQGEA